MHPFTVRAIHRGREKFETCLRLDEVKNAGQGRMDKPGAFEFFRVDLHRLTSSEEAFRDKPIAYDRVQVTVGTGTTAGIAVPSITPLPSVPLFVLKAP